MQLTQSQTQIGSDVYLCKCLPLSLRHTFCKGGQIFTQVGTDWETRRPPETIKQVMYTLHIIISKAQNSMYSLPPKILSCIPHQSGPALIELTWPLDVLNQNASLWTFIESLIKQFYAVRFRGKSAQTKRLLAVILLANISFLTHFPHFSVLISLFLAESEGGWEPIGCPVKGMWGHNSWRPPLSASQPPHKAEIKPGPGTQTETSIFTDQLQIERKRRPKKWRNKLDVNIGVWDQEPGQPKSAVQSNWPLVVFLSLCTRTCVFC